MVFLQLYTSNFENAIQKYTMQQLITKNPLYILCARLITQQSKVDDYDYPLRR